MVEQNKLECSSLEFFRLSIHTLDVGAMKGALSRESPALLGNI